jgi:hypothetical protein
MCCRRASPGVTPKVAVVGGSGARPSTGRAAANMGAGAGRANGRIGREVANAAAGTTVAARRLRKRSIRIRFAPPLSISLTLRTWW